MSIFDELTVSLAHAREELENTRAQMGEARDDLVATPEYKRLFELRNRVVQMEDVFVDLEKFLEEQRAAHANNKVLQRCYQQDTAGRRAQGL